MSTKVISKLHAINERHLK